MIPARLGRTLRCWCSCIGHNSYGFGELALSSGPQLPVSSVHPSVTSPQTCSSHFSTSVASHDPSSRPVNPISSSSSTASEALHTCDALQDLASVAEGPASSLGFCTAGAAMLEWLHTTTGLPWWAVLPLTTFTVKSLLLPLSLRQAAVVRSHLTLWGEAFQFLQQREVKARAAAAAAGTGMGPGPGQGSAPGVGPSGGAAGGQGGSSTLLGQQLKGHFPPLHLQGPPAAEASGEDQSTSSTSHACDSSSSSSISNTSSSSSNSDVAREQLPAQAVAEGQAGVQPLPGPTLSQLEQLLAFQQRLHVYHELRRRCGVPHPSWIFVNNLSQLPIFFYTAACIRRMALVDWPGFSTGGALWFRDVTLTAAVLQPDGALLLPMGLPGLILPLGITACMLTSIHIGFQASGAASRHPSISGTWLAALLRHLKPILYTLTLLNAAVKVQLPQAALLHWATNSSYTLGLQVALKNPRIKTLLGVHQAPDPGGVSDGVDPQLVTRVAANQNPYVLVVMGAQQAAMQRYENALYCLQQALALDPNNMRAHYSKGQIHALCQDWEKAAESYAAAVALAKPRQSEDPVAYGQSLYCLGVARQRLQQYDEAIAALREASSFWPQPYTLALSLATALDATGARAQALEVVSKAMEKGPGAAEGEAAAVRQALEDLQVRLSASAPAADE